MCSFRVLKSASTSSTSRDPGDDVHITYMMSRTVNSSSSLAQHREQILHVDHADDVVDGFVVDRKARETRLFHHLERIVERCVCGHRDDIGARRHYICVLFSRRTRTRLPSIVALGRFGERAQFFTLLDEHPELVGRMHRLALDARALPDQPQRRPGGRLQCGDEGRRDPRKCQERRREPFGDLLGVVECECPGRQFAEHHLQIRREQERDYGADADSGRFFKSGRGSDLERKP